MIWFVIGIIAGAAFMIILDNKRRNIAGNIIIQDTEDGPYIFLELEHAEELDRSDMVYLRIKRYPYTCR